MKKLILALAALIFAGCAATPQLPISYSATAISKGGKIGIVYETMPDVQMNYPGASCLLCLAAAATANSNISSYAKTLDTEPLDNIQSKITQSVKSAGFDAVSIKTPIQLSKLPKAKASGTPNSAKLLHTQYKTSHQVDYLYVLDINFIGLKRNYSSYVPTSPPLAGLSGVAYIVDLSNNTYVWYKPMQIFRSAEGEWKEPPNYPGITNAYYQSLEQAKDQLVKPFADVAK